MGVAAGDLVRERADEGSAAHRVDVHVGLHPLDAGPGQHPVEQHPVGIGHVRLVHLHPLPRGRQFVDGAVVQVKLDVLDVSARRRVGVDLPDLCKQLDPVVLAEPSSKCPAGLELVAREPVARVLAVGLGHVEVTALHGIDRDLERINALVEIDVQTEDEPAGRVDRAVAAQHDVPPVETTGPVQRVILPVRLQDDVLREPNVPVDQCPVHRTGVGAAARMDEVDDRVVRTHRLEPHAAPRAANRRLVGDPAQHVCRHALVLRMQANRYRHQALPPAGLALDVPPVAGSRTSSLAVGLGMSGNAPAMVLAFGVAATRQFVQTPQPARRREPFDFADNAGIRLERRAFVARLAADRGDHALDGAGQLVRRVPAR